MPYWGNDIFRLEIDEVFGNENTLDLDSSTSVIRKFQIRQIDQNDKFEPIPYSLANLVFYDYVMRFEAVYVNLPFKNIRFIEDPDGIGEIFNAEVTYSWDIQKNTEEHREFTLPTFSIAGGKKKQLLPATSTNHRLKRYVKSGDKAVEYKMIGWDGKKFNGVEIEAPDSNFMVPAWYPVQDIDFRFMRRLQEFIGTVNSEPFYGLEPGECMYLGPEQSWTTRTVETNNPNYPVQLIRMLELQHKFKVQLSLKDVKFGDIEIPKVTGWDYVDVHYEESLVDIGDGKKVPLAVPKQVDVVPVCEELDFWELFDERILEE